MDWAEDLGDAPETTLLFGREVECRQLTNDLFGCLLLGFTTPNVGIVFLVAAGFLLIAKRPQQAALLVSTGVVLITVAVLERIVRRLPPSAELVNVLHDPGPFGYPSGHTAGAVVFYGLIFYFAGAFIRPRLPRLLVQAACVYIVVFLPIERLYTGVHWLSDIYSGALYGALWLAPIVWTQRRRLRAEARSPTGRQVID